jgi:putative ABC transport system permease protein
MSGLSQDLRFAIRTMAKSRGFTIVAILTLALGIGANSAIFSVVNAVLLRPLPFADSGRLLAIWGIRLNNQRYPFRIADFLDFRDRVRAFDQVAAYGNWSTNLTGEAEPQRVTALRMTANFFEMLGIRAAVGRALVPDDDTPGRPRVVVLSYGLWQRRFGSDKNVAGRKITLSGDPYTIVGVAPRDFVLPAQNADVYIPLAAETDPTRSNRASISFLRVFGRMKPGVTPQKAVDDLNGIAAQLRQEHPKDYDATIEIAPLRDEIVGNVRLMLLVILGAVGTVLLIACANLASFLLAKASARRKELAIRAALGGSRLRLIRQLLTESMILSMAGGALGAALAVWGVDGLVALIPANLPRSSEIHVDVRMFWLALSISVLSGLLFGLLPALEASAADFNHALRAEGRSSAGSLARNRMRRLLVVGEVALSLMLLIAAGLLLKSFLRLQELSPGFESRNVMSVRLALPAQRYSNRESVSAFYEKLQPRLASLPGVELVSTVSILPLSGPMASADFQIAGRPVLSGKDIPTAQYRMIDWNYLATMRMPILSGRNFSERDTAQTQAVAIISESVARSYWPGQSPVGAHVKLDDTLNGPREVEIIGVAGDARLLDLESAPTPCLYVPLRQIPHENARWIANNMFWLVRTFGPSAGLGDVVRRQVHAVDPDVAAASIQPMNQYLSSAVEARRFSLSLIGVFAAAALLLAASGLYALISHIVMQRTREIGVRVALGAQARDIFWQVLGEGLLLTSGGVAIGLGGAFAIARLISAMLFGVGSHDLVTMLEVAALLAFTSLAASYFPARRAVSIDPLIALRED